MEAVSDSGLAAHVSEDKLRHWGAADVAMAYEENIRCHNKKKNRVQRYNNFAIYARGGRFFLENPKSQDHYANPERSLAETAT